MIKFENNLKVGLFRRRAEIANPLTNVEANVSKGCVFLVNLTKRIKHTERLLFCEGM